MPDERGPPQAGQADDPERHKQRQPEVEEKPLPGEVVGFHRQQQVMGLMVGVGDKEGPGVPIPRRAPLPGEDGRRGGGETVSVW